LVVSLDGRKFVNMDRKIFYNIYRKIQSVIAPRLRYSQEIYEEVLSEYCSNSIQWLDLGCGHKLLPTWRLENEKKLVGSAKLIAGIDADYGSLAKHKTIKKRVCGDICRLPFVDNTFDLITSNMVFEHLEIPEEQLREISRILKKGGRLIFHTPNKHGYTTFLARILPEFVKSSLVYLLQGRKEEDVFPAYYRINSRYEITKAGDLVGLKIADFKLFCSSAQLVIFPPLVVFELIWIRFLMSRCGKPFRTNIIAVMEKV
jgi:SAM-dependent methyltransferase